MKSINFIVPFTIILWSVLLGCERTSDDSLGASIIGIEPLPNSQLKLPITITFDYMPKGITLNEGTNQGITWNLQGNILTIKSVRCYYNPPSSRQGNAEVYLKWDTGAQHIIYECEKPPLPATTVSTNPPCGSTVVVNTPIRLKFDQPVLAVKNASGSGRDWEIPVWRLQLGRIVWTNRDGSTGAMNCSYNIR